MTICYVMSTISGLFCMFAWKLADTSATDWKLVWNDEFNEIDIDNSHWDYEIGNGCQYGSDVCGWGNQETQYYTNHSENAFIANGHLIIQARPEVIEESSFTSARMITRKKGDWLFGKIEVRAKFPAGDGLNSVIWIQPSYSVYGIWPASGALDIAAMKGNGNSVLTQAFLGNSAADYVIHSQEHVTDNGQKKFSDDFHVYAIEWEENKITWFINNNPVFDLGMQYNPPYIYPFNERFYLVLSLAVGGRWGNPENTAFPKKMEIDYVRVYQK